MDIIKHLPEDVAKAFKFKDNIPGPVFTENDPKTKKPLWDFDARTLTIAKCEELVKAKFPYIEAITPATASTKATSDKKE